MAEHAQVDFEVGGATSPGPDREQNSGLLARLKQAARRIKQELKVLYFAAHDPELGAVPKIVATCAVAYAVSPLDLIPDFIPVLGLLDDVIILPGLLWLAIKLTPEPVLQRARHRAETEPLRLDKKFGAAAVIFLVWDGSAFLVAWLVCSYFGDAWLHSRRAIVASGVAGFLAIVQVIWLSHEVWKRRHGDGSALGSAGVEEPLLADGGHQGGAGEQAV